VTRVRSHMPLIVSNMLPYGGAKHQWQLCQG
jgi:hypothetical protein